MRMKSGDKSELLRWFIFLLSCVLFAAGVVLAFKENNTGATICIVAGLLVLVFVYLSRFRKFSGLGFTGELWDDKQKEAAELIERLKLTSFAYARPVISLAGFVGRWTDGFSRRDRFTILEEIVQLMKVNGASDAQIADARKDFDRLVAVDLVIPIKKLIDKFVSQSADEFEKGMRSKFGSPITDIDGYNAASRELADIRKFKYPYASQWESYPSLKALKFLDDHLRVLSQSPLKGVDKLLEEITPLRDDVEAWFKTRELRRPSVYFVQPTE
jgi:hypothetical protein